MSINWITGGTPNTISLHPSVPRQPRPRLRTTDVGSIANKLQKGT